MFKNIFHTGSQSKSAYQDGSHGGKGKVPLVKTGPTQGQERSRNQNGQWRKKRSDTGVPRT
ncbi:hypothetical protein ABES03_02720 [Neobacillus rhizosphaerae]|uniref:hypothetical protein n=1 Tax=Neobacillus rhizosphaerae TaxID=2880965 RepID=UPI003D28500C